MKKEKAYWGSGGRKEAKALVKLIPGKGKILVNEKGIEEYFPGFLGEFILEDIKRPFSLTKLEDKFDVLAKVEGGGKKSQAEAIRLGISRALILANPDYRATLRGGNLLTRDPRMKERKKPGQKGARKKFQFTKR